MPSLIILHIPYSLRKRILYKTDCFLSFMKIKNLVLGIGIIIVFALALWQGIEAFYPSPKYDSFCNATRLSYTKIISPGVQCTSSQQLQIQEQQCYQNGGQVTYEYSSN